ncbi:carboxymuconolactone decarboxylase family protein [Xanthovirga aplysinae]|uniref:carboxymuconolactone decarboxylase family protein n=1 Tax=Xanthovirga aplysinae TaxID=2529853 RepID=UPI0012BB68B0|nr:carboxymuconolactone decarboxylase family protein [Xanthovirga aplysinae]MTI31614.1 carboxymuconolactone decarboxylase family protein [Xanthovirga aplysinae]
MKRQEIYKEIENLLGIVPTKYKNMPDRYLEAELMLMKNKTREESPIPEKYRELIGLAVAAVINCKYCNFYHSEKAKMHGVTKEEIEDALQLVKSTVGWSSYLNGSQMDFDLFKKEMWKSFDYQEQNKFIRGARKAA